MGKVFWLQFVFALSIFASCRWNLDLVKSPLDPSDATGSFTSINFSGSSEDINCGDNKTITCPTAASSFPFSISGTSFNVLPNEESRHRGFIHLFLKPLTQQGPWFIQSPQNLTIDPDGDWTINVNYGSVSNPPKDGDKIRITGVITATHLTSQDLPNPIDNLFFLKDSLNISYREFCSVDILITKPCYSPDAISNFSISKVDGESSINFRKKVDIIPCILSLSGKLEGLIDVECNRKLFVHLFVSPKGTSLWYGQKPSNIILDILDGNWEGQAQLGDDQNNIPQPEDKFLILAIAADKEEIIQEYPISDTELTNLIEQNNAAQSDIVEITIGC